MRAIEGYTLRQIALFYEQGERLTCAKRAARCLDLHLEGKAATKHIQALEQFANGR